MPREPIPCSACGAEMNRHAEKVDYGAAYDETADLEAAWGGVLMEFHACPRCLRVEERRSE